MHQNSDTAAHKQVLTLVDVKQLISGIDSTGFNPV